MKILLFYPESVAARSDGSAFSDHNKKQAAHLRYMAAEEGES